MRHLVKIIWHIWHMVQIIWLLMEIWHLVIISLFVCSTSHGVGFTFTFCLVMISLSFSAQGQPFLSGDLSRLVSACTKIYCFLIKSIDINHDHKSFKKEQCLGLLTREGGGCGKAQNRGPVNCSKLVESWLGASLPPNTLSSIYSNVMALWPVNWKLRRSSSSSASSSSPSSWSPVPNNSGLLRFCNHIGPLLRLTWTRPHSGWGWRWFNDHFRIIMILWWSWFHYENHDDHI